MAQRPRDVAGCPAGAGALAHIRPQPIVALDPIRPRRAMPPQFLRYAGAGAIGTAAHYAVLIALVQLAGIGAVAASTVGAVAGALVNYGLNHRYTFASRKAHAHALPRFAAVALGGIALNALVLAATLAVIGPHYLVAQVVATGAVLVAGYVANRIWTF
jgi:putative flippase GtrA